ncbi:hypothetical protein MUK42_18593 [Musa troglodytarum]|uniref:type I protein arginine methyltransferase n=1 Tax=Musa troglodytarum TaxID=320322 RepID=A0A9E7JHD6_9LILI|nr:hypothetical protein MUK42_18593 [Musa troglodytarum]
MEDPLGQKQSPQVFPSMTLSHLSSSAPSPSAASAFFSDDRSGCSRLRFHQPCSPVPVFDLDLRKIQIFKLGLLELLCVTNETGDDDPEEKSFSRVFKIGFSTKDEAKAFHLAFEQWKLGVVVAKTGGPLENGSLTTPKSKFDNKIDATSAKMYFHYYGQLLHQQNMLQDYVRTGTYYAAVIENRIDFSGRIVLDVGAGSGILSLFAAQAGAKHVYAVEASEMAEYARRLIAGNPSLGQRITVIKGKIEEVDLPEKADILISEPMGTLLVNERMLETYVIARDRFLIPDGKMFPSLGRIHMAPFSDEYLYVEIANKALFWQQPNYYGVDLTSLYGSAFQGYFSQIVWPIIKRVAKRILFSDLYAGNMSRRYSRTIYVGNLPGDVREREVEDLFYKYGPIIDIDLKIPPRPPGYAFIEFEDPRDADDAIRGRDGYNFDGHRLRVELAHGGRGQSSSFDRHSSYSSGGRRGGVSRRSEYRVMVTGLPSSASWQDLKDHMRRAGDVCFSEVFRDGGGTIGIVDYTNYDDMKYAIRKLDDSEFRNAFSRAYIRVKEYDSKRSLSRSRSHSRSYSRSPTPPRSRSRSRRSDKCSTCYDCDKHQVSEGKAITPFLVKISIKICIFSFKISIQRTFFVKVQQEKASFLVEFE